MKRLWLVAWMGTALCAAGCAPQQIRILSAGAIEPGLAKVTEQYRSEAGNEVKVQYGTAPQLAQRLDAGEAADILIAPPAVIEEQVKKGRVAAEGRVAVGRVGAGVTVRAGAPLPDIGTVEAFKQALLRADSIVYNRASTGLYLDRLFEKMGIAEQLKAKTTRYANGEQVMTHVINGKGNEIGFGAITEIRLFEPKGLKLVGPLPAEAQNYTSYSAGIMTGAPAAAAAKDFVRYLGTPAAKAAFTAAGVD